MKNASVESVLSILSLDAQENLRKHFLNEFAKSLLVGEKAVEKKAEKKETVKKAPKSLKVVQAVVEDSKRRGPSGKGLSDFVRTLPNATVKEVVEAGKKAGLTISEPLVYSVRTRDAAKNTAVVAPPTTIATTTDQS